MVAPTVPRETTSPSPTAKVVGVFILPSGGALDLDYVDLLDASWIIDHDTLAKRDARAARARDILGEIGTKVVRR